jgi:hypothetical protein
MGCQILTSARESTFYYIGWNRGVSVPMRNANGSR